MPDNARDAIASWQAACFPPQKLILAMPAYGYGTDAGRRPHRRTEPQVTLAEGNQVIPFVDLVQSGILVRSTDASGHVTFVANTASGWERGWDGCSSTPFLKKADMVIFYDDTESIDLKAAYAAQAGIAGVSLWTLSWDTPQWDLVRAACGGLGRTRVDSGGVL